MNPTESLHKWLRDFGLNNTEMKVYLCILSHPEIKVAEIQRQTNLVRTTIYYTLAQLTSQGLISENLQNNVKSYRAANIEALQHTVESRISKQQRSLDTLEQLRPIFGRLESRAPDVDTYVARFEGIGPIKQAIEEAFRCTSKRWHIIAARDNFLQHTSKQYQQYYLKERRRRGITAKTLWEPTTEFRAPSLEDMLYRNPKRLPEEFRGAFKSLVILYDDTTLLIDPYSQKTAYAIHGAASTHLLRLLHESIWRSADKVG